MQLVEKDLVRGSVIVFIVILIAFVVAGIVIGVESRKTTTEQQVSHVGRGVGNLIYEYACSFLRASATGKEFVAHGNTLATLRQSFPQLPERYSWKIEDKNFAKMEGSNRIWAPNVNYYTPHLPKLRELFAFDKIQQKQQYDVVIHIRLDDMFTPLAPSVNYSNTYTLLPLQFYTDALLKCSTRGRVLVVYREASHYDLQTTFQETMEHIRSIEGIRVIDTQKATEEKDFKALAFAAPRVIMSVSTFSFWAIMLSPRLLEIHLPVWGIFTDRATEGSMHATSWVPDIEGSKVIKYNLPDGFKDIRSMKEWRKYSRLGMEEKQQAHHTGPGLGNMVFDYAAYFLRQSANGKDFVANAKNLPSIRRLFPRLPERLSWRVKDDRLRDYKGAATNWPADISFYQPHLEKLREVFDCSACKQANEYDAVIHIRLDDIFVTQRQEYTMLPLSFYRKALEQCELRKRVLVVYRESSDAALSSILKETVDFIKTVPGVEQVVTQSGSETEDFHAIMYSAPNIILSLSTFSFWAAFLSPCVVQVIVPYYGMFKSPNNMNLSSWKPSIAGSRIVLQELPSGFKSILSPSLWRKFKMI